MRHKVFVVDDHPLLRRGYSYIVERESDLTLCGEADSAALAIDMIDATLPDLVITDISLEGMSGIELIKHLHAQHPQMPILVVSMHDETLFAERALRAGARGYIMKSSMESVIVGAIRQLLKGGFYLSDRMNTKVMLQFQNGNFAEASSPLDQLTDRELEVFEHYGRGLTTREISEALHISPKTVETHRGHIKEKLALDTSSELVQRAVQWVQSREYS